MSLLLTRKFSLKNIRASGKFSILNAKLLDPFTFFNQKFSEFQLIFFSSDDMPKLNYT